MALVWPITQALWSGQYPLALLLFVVAALSDGLDGFLAKHFGWQSNLGKLLDPMADKLLLVTVFVSSTWLGLVPWWLTAAAVARDVLIGLGAVVFRFWFGPLRGRPTVISKINTATQLGYLTLVLVHAAAGFPSPEALAVLAVLTFCSTLASGIDYMVTFTRRAWTQPAGLS
jgi:cardiolipin synthase